MVSVLLEQGVGTKAGGKDGVGSGLARNCYAVTLARHFHAETWPCMIRA